VQDADLLLEWLTVQGGVDGIFADQPDVVVRWRNQRLAADGKGNPFRLLNAGRRRTRGPQSDSARPSQPENPQK
jgi:hypothetical protein